MIIKRPMNLAGLMGRDSFQPAAMMGQMTVDPMERLNQKMAGRKQGQKMKGLKAKKPASTMMTRGYNG